MPRLTGGLASSQTPRRASSPSAIDSWRSLAFFFFSVFASADELSGVADDGGRTRSNTTQGGSLRRCSPCRLRAESHLAAPRRRPTRRLSSSAAAPDHIKLSYSSDNNFRLLHSGPPYSQQWLWEAPGKAVEEELSGDEDEKQ